MKKIAIIEQELSEDAERYIEQIRNRSEVLKELTEELFRYSVIASTPKLMIERVNLCRVLEENLLSFEGEMKQEGIKPRIQIPDKPVWRNLDSSALSRIFSNVVSNAMKYSDGDFEVFLKEDGNITFSNSAKDLSQVEVGKLFRCPM